MITACIECGRTKCKGCKSKISIGDKFVTVKKAYKIAKEMFDLDRQEVGEFDYFRLNGETMFYEEPGDIVSFTEQGWVEHCRTNIATHFANLRKAERAAAEKERDRLLGRKPRIDN